MKLSVLVLPIAVFAAEPPPPSQPLWPGDAPEGNGRFSDAARARITVHLPEIPNGAAVIICPGGGYGGLVIGAEGHGIAEWLNRHGVVGVVLEYRLPAGRPEVPLLDAQRAIRTTRSRAAEWKVDPKKVGIIGFSAGGHLASTAAVHFDAGDRRSTDAIDRQSSRPDFAILIYPVIRMDEGAHAGSRKNLLGENPAPALVDRFSTYKHVEANSPPAFLAHAVDDKGVPIENSRLFHQAQLERKLPSVILELPSGGHGLNRYQGPMWEAWQAQSLDWLRGLKFIR